MAPARFTGHAYTWARTHHHKRLRRSMVNTTRAAAMGGEGRRAGDENLSAEDANAFKPTTFQPNRVGREASPEVARTVSLVASRVGAPSVTCAQAVGAPVRCLKDNSCSCPGTADKAGAQGAMLAGIADNAMAKWQRCKVSPFRLKSNRV